MTPKDPAISSAGSDTLSAGDIEKIQCLYNCEGTSSGTCGGHQSGEVGVLQSSGSLPFTSSGTQQKVCKWLLAATSGDAIELSFESFNVDCSSGSVSVYDGRDDTDHRPLPALLGRFCSPDNLPSLITSSSKYLYVVYENSADDNNFKANWAAVTVSCCTTVSVTSEDSAVTSDSAQQAMLGNFAWLVSPQTWEYSY